MGTRTNFGWPLALACLINSGWPQLSQPQIIPRRHRRCIHRRPHEGHGLRDPDNTEDSMRRTIEWFDRYLK